jgi:hypothetical protein
MRHGLEFQTGSPEADENLPSEYLKPEKRFHEYQLIETGSEASYVRHLDNWGRIRINYKLP